MRFLAGVGAILAVLGYALMVRMGRAIRNDPLAEAVYDSGYTGCAMAWFAWALMIGGVAIFIFAAVSSWHSG